MFLLARRKKERMGKNKRKKKERKKEKKKRRKKKPLAISFVQSDLIIQQNSSGFRLGNARLSVLSIRWGERV